ncbi:hypothetical protein PYW08_001801 [Mythimna loreyi]|uniref:Uncharacterized protein n=1 Tax=Mythimna loreyi TaxID=667449 RepID=A0ACC2R575_9NEOP|nr:hypothetical protein PYW08_001801 [Mythimna loreyi]
MASFTFVLLAVSLLTICSAAPQEPKYGITLPEECKGKGFCSIKPKGYDEIEARIKELLPANLIELGSRTGFNPIPPQPEDDDNCPSEVTVESVYAYEDPLDKRVDIIVQSGLFPQQLAKVNCKYSQSQIENLKNRKSDCFRNLGLSAFVNFSCQESMAMRTLVIYDLKEDRLKTKNYPIPVCCSCRIS